MDGNIVSYDEYANIGDISKLIDENQLDEIAKHQANNFKVKNILTKIRKPSVKVISKITVIEKTNVIDNQTVQIYQPESPRKIPRKEDASKNNNVEVIENPKIVEPKDVGDKTIKEPQKSTDKIQLDSHHQTHASDDRGLVKQVGKVVLDKEKHPEEKDQKLENLARKKIVQDVVDGKINTPIPTEAVKPMLQGEQALKDKFEKL